MQSLKLWASRDHHPHVTGVIDHALVDDVVATIDALIKNKDNELEVDPTLNEMRADVTKVRQSLFNLLVEREQFVGGDWVRLAVADSGIGISSDKLERVFEEFSQADETTTRDYGGTGLGLPISRRFCQMMGGDITVQSTLGTGSTFTIRLPLRGQTKEESGPPANEPLAVLPEPTEGTPVVLVIDDDPSALELLERTLEGADVRVVTATHGEEALVLARSLQPAAITLDVLMPVMDGFEFVVEMRKRHPLANIPIVVVTAKELADDDRQRLNGEVAGLIQKAGIDREALLAQLREQVFST